MLDERGFGTISLISPTYLEQNRWLHKVKKTYGNGGHQHLRKIEEIVKHNWPITSILDYGAGKGSLRRVLGPRYPFIPVQNYDPVTFPCEPRSADLVICTDVLEHIEPDYLDAVLNHIMRLTLKVGFLTIATRAANKTLPDGRNAHLIQKPPDWWLEGIEARFKIPVWNVDEREITAVVYPL